VVARPSFPSWAPPVLFVLVCHLLLLLSTHIARACALIGQLLCFKWRPPISNWNQKEAAQKKKEAKENGAGSLVAMRQGFTACVSLFVALLVVALFMPLSWEGKQKGNVRVPRRLAVGKL